MNAVDSSVFLREFFRLDGYVYFPVLQSGGGQRVLGNDFVKPEHRRGAYAG
jgi:hypothetical protein